MANIRALAKRLLAGGGPARHRIGGWVRVDADDVIRGWAWDEADPARRLRVRVFVDSKPVAEVLADRLDGKLRDEAKGDGRYGFAVVAPPAFRDGREHSFEAVVEEVGYRLTSKARTFVIDPDAAAPRLHLVEITPTGLRARLRGGKYGKDTPLELWSGGERIDPAQLTAGRVGDGPQAELTLDFPREVFAGMHADAVVALPGMVEAGAGAAPVISPIRLRAEPRDGGVAVWLDGPLWLGEETSEVTIVDVADGRVLAREDIRLGPDPVLLALADAISASGARAQVSGGPVTGLDAVVGDPAPEPGAPANLIRNAELTDWPNGVLVRGGPARFELARGWHARNSKSPAPLRAMAFPLDQEGEACSLTLAAPSVGDYCRLEADVESRAVLGGRRLVLSFEAAVAHGPLQAFRPADDFAQIERIFLAPDGGRTGEGVTIARSVLLTGDMRRFDFVFEAPADLGAGPLVLAFDFRRAFAATLQRPSLTFTGAGVEGAAALAFEDPAIEAQAALLEGFGDWLSRRVVTPAAAPQLDRPAPRWAPPPAEQDSVEVVICMHDAAAETLDCLRSLVSGSRLPHLVRIVDDASGEDSRRRIEAFIADKPWMRLDPNPGHLGYTASANRGLRASVADWVILLNSDTVVSEGWIEGLLEAAAADPKIAMVGPLSNAASFQSVPDVVDAAGKLAVNPLPAGWTVDRMAALVRDSSERAFPSLPLLNGFCTLIRRQAFLDIGGFDEAAFPMGYGEENDLCLRLGEAGWRLVVADQVYVHHKKSASFGAERRAALQAEGTAALKRLHPGLDLAALTAGMAEIPALKRIRALVRAAWDEAGG